MAKPDDYSFVIRAALRVEEADIAAFFDAARAEPVHPSPAFFAAVLADAASVAAARAPDPHRRRPWLDFAAHLRPLGGWPGATALAGCAAIGLWAGTLGAGSGLVSGALWADVVTLESTVDGVAGFFDVDATES